MYIDQQQRAPASAARCTVRRVGLILCLVLGAAMTSVSHATTPTFTRTQICPSITSSPDINAVDFNGDGRPDVLVGGLDHIVLCANAGGGSFNSSTLVAAPDGANTKVMGADVNGDGKMDIVGIDAGADQVVWWRNNGDGTFTKSVIGSSVGGPSDLFVTDLDGDGDKDIITSSYNSNQIVWWRNDGAIQSVPKRLYISDRGLFSHRIIAVDPQTNTQVATISVSNSPGDLAAAPDGKKLYAVAGSDVLVIDVLTDTVVATVAGAGGDGSGTQLAVSPDGSRVYVASHQSSAIQIKVIDTGTDSVVKTVKSNAFNACAAVMGFGIQPSGGSLYLACSGSLLSLGSHGSFFMIATSNYKVTQTATFTNTLFNTAYVNAMAVKPDGSEVYLARADLSLFGVAGTGTVEVFNGSTGAYKQSIALPGGLLTLARAARVTPDGGKLYVTDSSNGVYVIDLGTKTVTATLPASTSAGNDIVMSSDGADIYTSMSSQVHINDTANDASQGTITGSFSSAYNLAYTPGYSGSQKFTKVVITSNFMNADSVRTADLDHDGRLDVLGASHGRKQIAWWRNNGDGTFTKSVIDNGFATAAVVRAADIDGDGWADVVAAGDGSGGTSPGLAWWRNNHNGTFTKHVIDSYGSSDVEIADLDKDGHQDVAAMTYGTTQVLWWQNNGAGTFTRDIADTSGGELAIELGDLDSDGYQDIVESGTGENIYWWHNNGAAGAGIPFAFNAVEPQTGSAAAADKDPLSGKIHTKVVNQAFNLDLVALADSDNNGVADGVDTNYAIGGDRTLQLQVVTGDCSGYTVLETLPSVVFQQSAQATEQGRKQVSLTIHNVGQNLRLRMIDDNGTPADTSDDVVGCSTDVFTVRPARYTLEVWQNDAQSAGASVQLNNGSSSAAPVHKAGRPLRVIAKAVDANGNVTAGFVGHSVTLKETKGDAAMRSGNYFYNNGVTPAQLTFDGSVQGTAISDAATYKEVGWLYLEIQNDDTYAVAGGDGPPNDGSTAAELEIQGSGQITVGRFIPDHFTVTASNTGAFQPRCGSAFTYLGQPFGQTVGATPAFQSNPVLVITAQNADGDTTQNYTGAYWKLGDISESYVHSTPALGGGVALASTGTPAHTPSTASGSNGAVTVTFTGAPLEYTRTAAVAAPFSPVIDLRFTVLDSDGVTCASCNGAGQYSLVAAAGSGIPGPGNLRYGRLAFTPDPNNNHADGPVTAAIDMGVRAEYYTGTSWILNSDDICTAITPANFDLKSDAPDDPALGNDTVAVGASGSSTMTIADSPLTGTATQLWFSPPSGLNYGTVDFIVDLTDPPSATNQYPWLTYDWDGNGTLDNLRGSVRFGPYANIRWMYMRETW